ncbi:response regulator transcription factor [Thermaerobacillus caldiproteolyticus]|uniref:response regulator transcription factor n=1 Tax=Thermaerobacillus caldiproteolyticus TaxID=247480 RepID=UPI0018F19EC2|nr:response regulator transcription factor [Anoxybacillus caldiproteolyticus]
MKIAVVDDEALERKALKKMIREHLPQADVVAEAANGRAAVEVANEYKPDVMLMDIKMPGMDGLEAVRLIRKQHPNIKFIIVSAFDAFEYAKQAMQQGVKEYLLKPSRKEEVIGALQRVYAEMMEERKKEQENRQLQERVQRLQKLVEKEWLSVLMLEEVSPTELEQWRKLLPFSIEAGVFVVIKFPPHEPKEVGREWLDNVIATRMKIDYVIGKMIDDQVPVLLFSKTNNDVNELKVRAQKLAHLLVQLFQQEHKGRELYIGIGTPAFNMDHLRHSYYEALSALQYYAAHQKAKSGFLPKQAALVPVAFDKTEKEKQLFDTVRQGDMAQALQQFQLYMDDIIVAKKNQYEAVTKSLEETFILLERMLSDLGILYERANTFHQCSTIHELKRMATEQLRQMVHHVQAWRHQQANGKLGKAKEYIAAYYDRPLTLEEVAEHVGLSPYYFSKLFKDRFGMTFIDYLTEVRIERAKEEMRDPKKSLKEVCFLVGYNDPNYFSRVFKKQTGLSPTEYRKTLHIAL